MKSLEKPERLLPLPLPPVGPDGNGLPVGLPVGGPPEPEPEPPEEPGFPLLGINGLSFDDREADERSKVNWNIVVRSCMSRVADSSVVWMVFPLPVRKAAIQGDFVDEASESNLQVVPISTLEYVLFYFIEGIRRTLDICAHRISRNTTAFKESDTRH